MAVSRILPAVAVLSLPAFAGAQAERVEYWDPAQGGNGHWYGCYEMLGAADFDTARAEAQARGGDLASLSTAAEHAWVEPLATDPTFWITYSHGFYGPWFGLRQDPFGQEPAAGWEWVDGSPLTFTNWLPGTPDQWFNFEEDYAAFKSLTGFTPTWNDLKLSGFYQEPLTKAYLAEFAAPYLESSFGPNPLEFRIDGQWGPPNSRVLLAIGTVSAPGTGAFIPLCGGVRADIDDVRFWSGFPTDADGGFEFAGKFPAWSAGLLIYVQSFDPDGCRLSNVLKLRIQ